MHTCTQACTGTRSRSRSHSHSRSRSRSCSCCFVDSTCHQPVMAASSLQELAAMRYLTTCELDKRRHLVTDVRIIKRRMTSSTCLATRCRPDVDLFRAVDNALTLFRVWPFKNVGAILGHANAAVLTDNMQGCGKF